MFFLSNLVVGLGSDFEKGVGSRGEDYLLCLTLRPRADAVPGHLQETGIWGIAKGWAVWEVVHGHCHFQSLLS